MNKLNFTSKRKGDTLEASEWNTLVTKTDELVQAINDGATSGSGSGEGGSPVAIDTSGVVSVNEKGNVTIGSNNIKNINLEPGYPYSQNLTKYGDIALKPGDDILFFSHHREPKKRDKIVVKNVDGDDNPVKACIVAGELELAVGTENNPKTATMKKDPTTGEDLMQTMFKSDDAKVMDVKVLSGYVIDKGQLTERDERAYLKVRAQAIDLRCEKHGGISLQPKGYDAEGHMDKIKFEHGGGDGLEFGTFNTEKTSIFTDEYRFNKDGIWKMATREKVASGKTILDEREGGLQGLEATAAYKYKKNDSDNQKVGYEPADDFYDFINTTDELCTTKDIIKTANALNSGKNRHIKYEQKTKDGVIKKTVEIATEPTYVVTLVETPGDPSTAIAVSTISSKIAALTLQDGDEFNDGDFTSSSTLPVAATVYTNGTQYFTFTLSEAPSIKIDSGSELKLGGVLDFGSTFNFGETDGGIEVQYKLTKKNAPKDCGVLKVVGVNNHTSNNLTVEGVTIAPGETNVIAQCSILDIIKLVNFFKTGAGQSLGPWAQL